MNRYILFLLPAASLVSCSPGNHSVVDTAQDSFHPGAVWYDTDSVPIEAHSCGILKSGNTYYMYGQDQRLGHGNKTGVCGYSSSDLYHWKYEGTVLPTDNTPEITRNSGVLERPKVIFNASTGKYVMWMHLDADDYTLSEAGVAASDSPTGPFKFVKHFRPVSYDYGFDRMNSGADKRIAEDHQRLEKINEKDHGNTFRDMNLFVDDDGSAYVIYSSENNSSLYIVKLSDNYLDVARPLVEGKTWSRAVIDQKREAPAPFKYRDTYYIISSGLTGWASNPAKYHTAQNMLGPWTTHENPCRGPGAEFTFGSQSTFVLPAPGKPEGCYIFMADIWDADKLENSRLFWQPFLIQDDGSFTIENLDKWSLDVFDTYDKPLERPKLTFESQIPGSTGKSISWDTISGADAYHIFINGKWLHTTTDTRWSLPQKLAGNTDTCCVERVTISGKQSEKSLPAIVSWDIATDVMLSGITPDAWTQGFSYPHLNLALQGTPLKIVDRDFREGFGVHAPSMIQYTLSKHYKRFTAWIGVDAYTRFNQYGSVEFIVTGDGEELYRSGIMKAEDQAKYVDLRLDNIVNLTLIVTDGGNGNHYDHADWCEPELYANE